MHGGRWTRETRLTNTVIDEALARDGALVMALDIRMPPVARYPDCLADINFAIRWLEGLRAHAGRAGGRVRRHRHVERRPSDDAERVASARSALRGLRGPDGIDASLAFLIAGWPVLDPLARYRMAKAQEQRGDALGAPRLLAGRSRAGGGQPADDPRPRRARGAAAGARRAGHRRTWSCRTAWPTPSRPPIARPAASIDLRKFDGQPHTFITKEPAHPASSEAIEVIKAFIRERTGAADLPRDITA